MERMENLREEVQECLDIYKSWDFVEDNAICRYTVGDSDFFFAIYLFHSFWYIYSQTKLFVNLE